MEGNWAGSSGDDHDPLHCTHPSPGTWQPYLNNVALLPDWMRSKHLTSDGPIRVPTGVTRRQSKGQRDRLTSHMAGPVRDLGGVGSPLECHMDRVATKAKEKEPNGRREVQKRGNGKDHSVAS